MNNELEPGRRLATVSGAEIVIKKKLGEGGQGFVYLVDYKGDEKALKWYKRTGCGKDPEAFYRNLENNVRNGSPSPEFLWPLDLTERVDHTFGYVMDLKPRGYYEISDFMLLRTRFGSYKAIIDASLKIVSAFRMLHGKGYSYQDMNDGNFFINPMNGDVKICDNDNVAPNGTQTGILGKPRYIAPEIVQNRKMPDSLSDRFSMSVILFILFCLNHPLEGKRSLVPRLSPELQEKLYGSDPVFIMDPDNHSNAPDPVIHRNTLRVWPCLPDYMQDIFIRAFGKKALENPNARPTESDWIRNLVRFRSDIVSCNCGNEIFTENGKPARCDRCGTIVSVPYRIVFPDYSIPGIAGTRIYRCQAGVCNSEDALKPTGWVVSSRSDPAKLGLKNMTDKTWKAVTPSGKSRPVGAGEIIPMKDGIRFTIEDREIRIEANHTAG
ncbi:MAG: serine/threonine-protein kinase [Eubacterium sp.]|nr:serine/threonine-protein kinase [Eubacterium sp.]